MKQVIISGHDNNLPATATEYNGLLGQNWSSSEGIRHQLVSTPGKISSLRVKLATAPGVDKSFTFTLMVGGNPSALTCAISGTDTSAVDSTHEVDVVAGQRVSLRCEPSGEPTVSHARWSVIFEGSTAKQSLILGCTGDTVAALTEYGAISTNRFTWTATEDNVRQVIAASGKIKNLYVKLSLDPGDAPEGYKFTLRVNGESSALTVTITADDTTGNDTTHEVSVSPGDIVTFMCEPVNSPTVRPSVSWGMTFEADIDGESLILGGQDNALDDAATEYNHLASGRITDFWVGDESTAVQLGQECVLKNLYILLSGAPGAGNSYTFTIRQNSVDSDISVPISGTDTIGNDTTHTLDVLDGGDISLQVVPADAPTVRDAYWGAVGYVAGAPPVGIPVQSFMHMQRIRRN